MIPSPVYLPPTPEQDIASYPFHVGPDHTWPMPHMTAEFPHCSSMAGTKVVSTNSFVTCDPQHLSNTWPPQNFESFRQLSNLESQTSSSNTLNLKSNETEFVGTANETSIFEHRGFVKGISFTVLLFLKCLHHSQVIIAFFKTGKI